MPAYSFKRRFVTPIRVGLGILIDKDVHPKRQTIRAIGKRRHARPGETVQLYCGMRTRECFKIGEAICTSLHEIVVSDTMSVLLDGKVLTARQIQRLARDDGFRDADEMGEFWRAEHGDFGKFNGVLIRWEPAREQIREDA